MSEMSEWIAQMRTQGDFRIPSGEFPIRAPGDQHKPEADIGTPPVAPPPVDIGTPPVAPPTAPPPMWGDVGHDPSRLAPLELFLKQHNWGGGGMSDEQYKYWGGDDLLKQLQMYDPNAKFIDFAGGPAGEGGYSEATKQLEFDYSKLPMPQAPVQNMPGGWAPAGNMKNPEMKYYDPVYGWLTPAGNVDHSSSGWDKYLPYAAAAMMAAIPGFNAAMLGAGLGSAGLTSAVTGAAAGLPASTIGLSTAAAQGATPWWLTRTATKAPNLLDTANNALTAPKPPARPPTPPPPKVTPVTSKVGSMQGMPDMYGFDPTQFNAGGSSAKMNSGDSQLVATQFAADPYGFSKG